MSSVLDLNQRLSSGQSRRTKERVYAEIDAFLRKKDLLQCFEITMGSQFLAELKFNAVRHINTFSTMKGEYSFEIA